MGAREIDENGTDKLTDGQGAVAAAQPTGAISDVFGLLKKESSPVLSIEEIAALTAQGWAGER